MKSFDKLPSPEWYHTQDQPGRSSRNSPHETLKILILFKTLKSFFSGFRAHENSKAQGFATKQSPMPVLVKRPIDQTLSTETGKFNIQVRGELPKDPRELEKEKGLKFFEETTSFCP